MTDDPRDLTFALIGAGSGLWGMLLLAQKHKPVYSSPYDKSIFYAGLALVIAGISYAWLKGGPEQFPYLIFLSLIVAFILGTASALTMGWIYYITIRCVHCGSRDRARVDDSERYLGVDRSSSLREIKVQYVCNGCGKEWWVNEQRN